MPATATKKRSVTGGKSKAKASSNGAATHRRSPDETLALAKSIKEMREAGKSWDEVKSKLGVDPAQGQYLIKVASVRPKDRIKADSEAELAKAAKALRKEGVSKAEIAARAGVSVAKVRDLLGKEAAGVKSAKPKAAPKAKAAPKPAKSKAEAKAAPIKRRRKRVEVAADPSVAA